MESPIKLSEKAEKIQLDECKHQQIFQFFIENETKSVRITSDRCLSCKAWLDDTMSADMTSLGYKNILIHIQGIPDKEVREHFLFLLQGNTSVDSKEKELNALFLGWLEKTK